MTPDLNETREPRIPDCVFGGEKHDVYFCSTHPNGVLHADYYALYQRDGTPLRCSLADAAPPRILYRRNGEVAGADHLARFPLSRYFVLLPRGVRRATQAEVLARLSWRSPDAGDAR